MVVIHAHPVLQCVSNMSKTTRHTHCHSNIHCRTHNVHNGSLHTLIFSSLALLLVQMLAKHFIVTHAHLYGMPARVHQLSNDTTQLMWRPSCSQARHGYATPIHRYALTTLQVPPQHPLDSTQRPLTVTQRPLALFRRVKLPQMNTYTRQKYYYLY